MDKQTKEILERLYGATSRKYNIPLEFFTLPEEYLFSKDEYQKIKEERNRHVNNLSAISPDYYSIPQFQHRWHKHDEDY